MRSHTPPLYPNPSSSICHRRYYFRCANGVTDTFAGEQEETDGVLKKKGKNGEEGGIIIIIITTTTLKVSSIQNQGRGWKVMLPGQWVEGGWGFLHLSGRLWIDQHLKRERDREKSEKKWVRQSGGMKNECRELSYKNQEGRKKNPTEHREGEAADEVWRLIFSRMGVSLGWSGEWPGSTSIAWW